MPVVSNTSPIWNLASIQRLDLLHDQFSEILIPSEVLAELRLESGCPETGRIQHALDAQWIQIESLKTSHLKRSLMLELDQGEAAAIALALEWNISRIIIDETDGRATAKVLGLHPTGILGVLLRGKHDGKIESVKHEMQKLRHEDKFVYTIHVDPEIDQENMQIPPMLVQPFIENSIEHGLMAKETLGHINVNFTLDGEQINIEITDDGIGFKKSTTLKRDKKKEHQSLAMSITQERLLIHYRKYKRKIQIKVSDLRDANNNVMGARVFFGIPFAEA